MGGTERDSERSRDGRASGSDGDSQSFVPDFSAWDIARMSRLAVVAGALGGMSLALLPGLVGSFGTGPNRLFHEVYHGVTFGTWSLAALCGLISLVRIGLSGGRLVGKGFAWVGVAVPTVEGLLLLLVLVLARPRCVAFRMTCGTNLSGLGKAIMLYSNDYQDELPCAGGRGAAWGQTADWMATNRMQAYGMQAYGTGGVASISASLYLLVKYAEVTPKMFLCGGSKETREEGVSEFKLGTYRLRNKGSDLIDLWDFGPDPTKHCSYAYQMVYAPYRLTVSSSDPAMAIAGDRNPWMDAPTAKARDVSLFMPEVPPFNGTVEQARLGNTPRHEGDGQNVMFLDTHVVFEKRSYCGFEDDNIYTSWDGADKVRGRPAQFGSQPAGAKDSLLVNDAPATKK